MLKFLIAGASTLLGLALAGAIPPEPPDGGPPPPPKAKKKGEPPKKKGEPHGPAGDLRKAYDLLRRLRATDRGTGRSEERLADWTERATRLYRDGLKAFEEGDHRLAHEYGAAAHDLARTVDHARNASHYEGPDSDLPPPPPGPGPEGEDNHVRADLRHAYDRIRDGLDDLRGKDARFYLDAARDLYNAARRDAAAGRVERAGELAKAAEAITHVPEHLAHAAENGPEPPRAKAERIEAKRPPRPFEAEDLKGERTRDDLPPPL